MIGILAYGSLIANPGAEIEAATVDIKDVRTPFDVEYARKSKSRAYAPTLVLVGLWQGGRVDARVIVLSPEINERQAVDMLYRRERDKVGKENVVYPPPMGFNLDSVIVERLTDFADVDMVFYTRIGVNLPEILDPDIPTEKKARLLAYLAIESLTLETYERGRDGIQYLADNLASGVETPLSRPYKAVILQLAGGMPTLDEARLRIATQKGFIA